MHSWSLGQRLDIMSVPLVHAYTPEALLGREIGQVSNYSKGRR